MRKRCVPVRSRGPVPPTMQSWRRRLAGAVLFPAAAVACAAGAGPADSPPGDPALALVGVHVVPMDRDTVLRAHTVLIRNGRIEAVAPDDGIELPEDAIVIDGAGRYLMPGLVDAHVHLSDRRSELPMYVAYGVTTIFEMGVRIEALNGLLALRDSARSSAAILPSLYLAGPLVDGDPPVVPARSVVVTDPASARAVVRRLATRGVDFVKVYNRVPPEAFVAMGAATADAGLALVGHVPRDVGALPAIDGGLDLIAHGEELFFTYFEGPRSTRDVDRSWRPDLARMPSLVRRLADSSVWVTPNLSFIATTARRIRDPKGYGDDPDLAALDPDLVADWRFSDPRTRDDLEAFAWREEVKYELVRGLVLALAEGGVSLLLGTDSALVGVYPGRSAHLELRELVDAGLTPHQALAAGTSSAGAFLEKHVNDGAKVGTVARGARADLLLLEANPLEDVRNAERIAGVVLRGRWIEGERLRAIRAGDR